MLPYEQGTNLHLQTDPTALELVQQGFIERKDAFEQTAKESILSRYGGEEHLDTLPKQLLLAETVSNSLLVTYFAFLE